MPDDSKLHQLPASLGIFPLFNVEDHASILPKEIKDQGGLFLPMWQREALWIEFSGATNMHFRVSALLILSDKVLMGIHQSMPCACL